MSEMIADQLKEMWESGQRTGLSWAECVAHQQQALNGYAQIWKQALLIDTAKDFRQNLLGELVRYLKLENLHALEAWYQKVRHAQDWFRCLTSASGATSSAGSRARRSI